MSELIIKDHFKEDGYGDPEFNQECFVVYRDGFEAAVGQFESANSALLDEAKRHSEFMKGKVAVGANDLQRIMELVERWAVSGSMDDRQAYHHIRKVLPERPWGEDFPQSTPTPLEQSGGKV